MSELKWCLLVLTVFVCVGAYLIYENEQLFVCKKAAVQNKTDPKLCEK